MLATLLLLLPVAACSEGGAQGDPAVDPTPREVSVADRCQSAVPKDAEARNLTLSGEGATLSAAVFDGESSGTALVLLHQTGPSGLCGWGRFAARAAEVGLPSVAIDMCGYGDSSCPDAMVRDPAAQVSLAVRAARDELGADRVVLVGASMGGSSTVRAVAAGAHVDAWVDVSGVSTWDGVRLLDLVPDLADAPPGMIVYARTDGPLEYGAGRRLARRIGARFVDGGSGHGYELMTDYRGRLLRGGRAVIAFARG